MAKEAFLMNPVQRVKRKNSARKSTGSKSKRTGTRNKNPYGQEVIVVGANPRKKKKKKSTRKRKAYKRGSSNPVARAPRKRTVRKRRTLVARAPRRRSYRRNPVRKRRARRNMPMAVGAFNLKKPMTFLMPVGTGVAAMVVTKAVPGMLNLTGNMRYAAQIGVAIVGGMFLQKPIGKQNAMIFSVVSLTMVVSEVLAERVGGVFAGLDAFVDEYTEPEMMASGEMGDFVDTGEFGEHYDETMGAFVTGDPSDPYGV